MNIEKKVIKILQTSINKIFGENKNLFPLILKRSTNLKFGDYQTNFAMVNSKILKENPKKIADKLCENVEVNDIIEKIDVAGPGFINITLTLKEIEKSLKNIEHEKQNFDELDRKGKIIIDYSSPNIAKRMHIGHLRSTVIGDSIKRIYDFLGYETISDNHIGDWGTQFGKLIVSYRKWLNPQNYKKDPIGELERLYVLFSEESEKDKSLDDEARFELKKLQNKDDENMKLWKEFIKLSLLEYKKIYQKLNIEFDTYNGESFYNEMMPKVVELLLDKKIAIIENDTTIVFFKDENIFPCIVRKKDGAFLYSTSDLSCIKYRREKYLIQKLIYVVDERQKKHFEQIFDISDRLGWMEEKKHVSFGIMKLSVGIVSSRKGNVIKLSNLIDESVKRAREIVESKNPNLSESEKEKISEVVGLGAIKYFDLSQNRTSDIVFNWDKALSFDGNTAPYLQYTYARLQSIIKKSKLDINEFLLEKNLNFNEIIERDLAISLLYFYSEVIRASKTYKPNIIADYIYDLAKKTNTFYNSINILSADEDAKKIRLFLIYKVSVVLKYGLGLLGIDVLDRM